MEKISIQLCFERKHMTELTDEQRDVVTAARSACSGSYSPYSGFAVGAAVALDNGEIVTASNQENAAYPSGLCAERVALFYAKSRFPDASILRMAIAAKSKGVPTEAPVPPCGACRQVMAETARRQQNPIELIMAGAEHCVVVNDVNELLPLQFNDENIK